MPPEVCMSWRILLVLGLLTTSIIAAELAEAPKPRIAFFPLGGDASEDLRDKCAFSLRAKLERAGTYEVIDGPKMREIAAESGQPIRFATSIEAIQDLAKLADAKVLVWGELANTDAGALLKLKLLDLRRPDEKPKELSKLIKQPTDLRFVSEEVLQALPAVKPFEHPSEIAVQNDAQAEELWKKNPNLVKNPEFSAAGGWKGIYQAQYYDVPLSPKPPALDKVVIYRLRDQEATNNVLAMNLSKTCAENNGLACLSDPIPIQPDTRYRLSFRYKSDGPVLHVFIKGYTRFDNIKGQKAEREIYRRQVPVTGATDGKWVTIVDELNPQHITFPVQTLRVDLYAYLQPGSVMFDDIVLKAVGKPTRTATDEAIDKPLSRPRGTK